MGFHSTPPNQGILLGQFLQILSLDTSAIRMSFTLVQLDPIPNPQEGKVALSVYGVIVKPSSWIARDSILNLYNVQFIKSGVS